MPSEKYLIRPLPSWADKETSPRRSSGAFRASWNDTLKLLVAEIEQVDGEFPIVVQVVCDEADLRLDRMLRTRAQVRHPGAVVWFNSKFGPLRYATDAYEARWYGDLTGWQANVRAIALTLGALRSIDGWSVTKRGEQYTGWKALPAKASSFADVFAAADWMRKYATLELNIGLGEGAEPGKPGGWSQLYRAMARKMHPDNGRPRADWDRLDEAKRLIEAEGWL